MMSAYNDLASLSADAKLHYNSVWESTYHNAPSHNPFASQRKRSDGSWGKYYEARSPEDVESRKKMKRNEVGFTGKFYDDEGWWALAWIGALDNTGKREYLDEAIGIWYDMRDAWNKPACGGIPWNKDNGAPSLAIENGKSFKNIQSIIVSILTKTLQHCIFRSARHCPTAWGAIRRTSI